MNENNRGSPTTLESGNNFAFNGIPQQKQKEWNLT